MTLALGAVRLERPELAARIRAALHGGSVVLVAHAGFGKTAALEEALEGMTAAWVRCGDAGGDPGRLLASILQALRTALPGSADVVAERLTAAREPVDPQLAVAALERELEPLLVDPLVLVLDDAETLHESPAALALVARLLARRVPALRPAIATRHPLALQVARARAAGWLTEIGAADLAFSAAETAAYLRLARGIEPSAGDVERVLADTSGWPLGVALAAQGDPRRPGPARELVDDYFEEEVLAALGSDLRAAVVAASIAPDLEIAAAAGIGPPEGVTDATARHGLFLRGGTPAAFHPLFSDALRARFAREVPAAERREAHANVARALEAHGRGAEAVSHWLASEDWVATAGAIAREGGALARTAPATVEAWLGALPPEYASQPTLRLLAGALAHGAGRLDEAVDLCRDAVAGLEAEHAPAFLRFAARFTLVDTLIAVGDLAGAAALGDTLDDPEAPGQIAACAVGAAAAAGLARQGFFEEGRRLLTRALADPAAAPLRPAVGVFEGYYFDLPAGRLDAALEHMRAGLTELEHNDPFGRLPYGLVFLLAILEERGEEDEALAAAAQARERAAQAGLAGWVGVGTAIRSASIHAQRGEVAEAERDLADVAPQWRAWGAWDVLLARAAIAAQAGDAARARTDAARAMREVQTWPYYDRTRCAALAAATLVRAGDATGARVIVETTLADAADGVSTARLRGVHAWLLHDEGDEEGSIAALTTAWAQAGDQVRHVLRREWPRIERPLWVALEHGAIDPTAAIAALPDGEAIGTLTRHPTAAVRRAAVLAAAASGHPDGLARIAELADDAEPDVASAARAAAGRLREHPPPLAFRTLGGFELRRGAWRVDEAAWERRVAERLVRLLLCRDEAVGEDDLFDAFWPDRPQPSARRGLQVAVSSARSVLDPPGARESRLEAAGRTYRLRLRPGDTLDAAEFARAAESALWATGGERRVALSTAAALWGGEPLPEERYSDWAIAWRERLTDRYAEVLAALSDEHAAAGDNLAAAEAARRIVELDPVHEGAHRRLIVAYARAGRRGHALRQFLACRRALVAQLGVEPDAETVALQRRVLAGEPL
jgi:LuxR family maltose regulon positive regulatory protein